MGLLLVTAFCAMVVADRGWPPLPLTLAALGGLGFAVGGAHAINMAYDKDIDILMSRTRNRPVPQGRISPLEALSFGLFLESVSYIWLASRVNQLTALLALGGAAFYVVIYTLWLKRRSTQNIVIGGAAGAFPPLVGWAAASGRLSWAAWGLFLIIFLWTTPHFWALALYQEDDYRRAGVPMMPVVRGSRRTMRQMLAYAALLWAASLALFWVEPRLTLLYLAAAVVLGAVFTATVIQMMLGRTTPRRVFRVSLWYTAGLFLAMVAGIVL
jgi:protoheme IX farnesyltransferase